jgi:hypothetical protein
VNGEPPACLITHPGGQVVPPGAVVLSLSGVRLALAAVVVVANLTDEEVAVALRRRRPGRVMARGR